MAPEDTPEQAQFRLQVRRMTRRHHLECLTTRTPDEQAELDRLRTEQEAQSRQELEALTAGVNVFREAFGLPAVTMPGTAPVKPLRPVLAFRRPEPGEEE